MGFPLEIALDRELLYSVMLLLFDDLFKTIIIKRIYLKYFETWYKTPIDLNQFSCLADS